MMAPTYPERVRGNSVRAWTGHRLVPPVIVTNIQSCVCTMVVITYVTRKGKGEIPYKNGGNTVRAWTYHRSVTPVTMTIKGKG